jgi:peptidoglycan/xylan/chitin deacetylase (PgdA/CDA1 family)
MFALDGRKIPVPPTLMLHSKDRWKLEFILKWLIDHGYTSLLYSQFATVLAGEAEMPDRPIILSIDDIATDYINNYFTDMVDLIERAGYTGIMGVVTRTTPAQSPQNYLYLRELANRGWEIDTHTTHHHVLPLLPTLDAMRVEIVDSAKMLEDATGQSTTSLIVPYASVRSKDKPYDDRIFTVSAEANLSFVVGMTHGRYIDSDQPPYYVGRVGVGVDSVQTAWWITHYNEDQTDTPDVLDE